MMPVTDDGQNFYTHDSMIMRGTTKTSQCIFPYVMPIVWMLAWLILKLNLFLVFFLSVSRLPSKG